MRVVRGWTGLAAGLSLVVAAGCGGSEEASAGMAGGGPGGMRPGDRVVPVEVTAAENGRIARSVTVSGNIEPLRIVGVNAQLAGALRTVAVEEGTRVEAGAVLASLDDREIAAQLASAEAAHEVAEATFARAERLRERQVITEAEYERDRAALAAAEAQLDQLRARMGYATIRAPVSGVVLEKHVEAGDIVGVQTRLFTIADVSTLVVRVQVSELDVVEIREGDAVPVELDAFADAPLTGRVRRIFPAANPTTRLLPVEVALTGADAQRARPGFLARITFALDAKENVILVPASAIVRDASSEGVYVVENDRARRRAVRTGLVSEGRVEITQGLAAGEVVVIAGTNNLRDGAAVRVVGAGAAPAERQGGMTP